MIEDYCKEDEVLLKKNPFKAPLTEAKKVKEFDEAEILTHTIAKCERKDCKLIILSLFALINKKA